MHTINIILLLLHYSLFNSRYYVNIASRTSTHHMYIHFFDKIVQETVKEKWKQNTI